VCFAEEIHHQRRKKTGKGYEVNEALGLTDIKDQKIWLTTYHPLHPEGFDACGITVSYEDTWKKLKPKLRQGEQYFITLLHEIAHVFRLGRGPFQKSRGVLAGPPNENPTVEEIIIDRWAFKEFRKRRREIRIVLREELGPSFMSRAALLA
jgi:hypothetical protein